MSKKTKTPVAPVTELEKQIAEKNAEIANLEAQAVAAREAAAKDQNDKINALPAHFGVENLDAVMKLIRKSQKGVVGRKSRSKVTDEIRARVIELSKEGKTGSEVSKTVGLSLPTIQAIRKAGGLVKVRTAAGK